jgi:hypothetical protein
MKGATLYPGRSQMWSDASAFIGIGFLRFIWLIMFSLETGKDIRMIGWV